MSNEKQDLEPLDWGRLAHGFNDMPPVTPLQMAKVRADSFNKSEGDLNQKDGHDCRLCRNKGYTLEVFEENGNVYTKSVPCKCMPTRRSIMLMKASGLENQMKQCRFETFETKKDWQKEVKDQAMEYASNPDGWFFFGGQSGAGKTHLCTAICRQLLLDGNEVRYMLWRDEINKLKSMVNSDEYQREIEKYKTVPVLYIDDLFKTGMAPSVEYAQRPTSADINIAFEILNNRYNNKLKTIISSECTLNELLDIDEAIAGRIAENKYVISISKDTSRNYRLRNMRRQ